MGGRAKKMAIAVSRQCAAWLKARTGNFILEHRYGKDWMMEKWRIRMPFRCMAFTISGNVLLSLSQSVTLHTTLGDVKIELFCDLVRGQGTARVRL